jgi:hypothetical protein
MDQSPDAPPQPAEYHRRKAAQARQQMKELTTPVMKARLLDLALHFDRLAADAERAAQEPLTRFGPGSRYGSG